MRVQQQAALIHTVAPFENVKSWKSAENCKILQIIMKKIFADIT